VRYSRLVTIVDARTWSKKTYNNAISIVRRAFDYGCRDHPEQHNPARGLRSARLKKKDRPSIDPFCMQDAETLIAAIHRDWGEAQGNYDEFRFFAGLRALGRDRPRPHRPIVRDRSRVLRPIAPRAAASHPAR
jgi:integrase